MSEGPPGAPALVTERLELWLPGRGDLPGLIRLHADAATRRHLAPGVEQPSAQFERLLRAAGGWVLYGYGMFTLRPRGSGEIVGVAGVFRSYRGFGQGFDDAAEAGWILRADHTGRGLAGEAMRAALDWYDANHGGPVVCMIEAGNTPSERLAAALGFMPYGRHRAGEQAPDLVLYERL